MRSQAKSLFDIQVIRFACVEALRKFRPSSQLKNPVIFVTLLGAVVSTICATGTLLRHGHASFEVQISLWLWFTVYFANFSEAVAEGRGKAQAESLKKGRSVAMAKLLVSDSVRSVHAGELKVGDRVVCEAFRVTARSLRASPAWTSPRSPGSRPRSSARAGAIVRR